MVRLWIGLAVAAVVFIVYSVVDCATMPRDRVRGISKTSWIIAILLLPVIGGVLWWIIGRVRAPKAVPRGSAPDDDPDFLKKLDADRAQTKRIRDLEDELNRFDDESGDSPDTTSHDDPTPGSDTPDDGSGRRPPGAPSAS
ncbi:PLD nuclease N-terminal domain-containing protein [Plantibacter sp. CFBP 13570]|uniref:PLD nuclease N-terminal domain-containing protein n=1 Tax=Plantibacter sp. CFBP 13570 TaxID=2775272 RepID=UPI001930C522|nr:PLD nuclease N-terminal domain-containing protein [Plantibacter sp. CFBP 13570]MBD8536189.1 PLDc_N domain-containing protein [Plantibacter sp. CFBP 13570]